MTIPPSNIQLARLVQTYGLTAFVYLYFTLLAGPFVIPLNPFRMPNNFFMLEELSGWGRFTSHCFTVLFPSLGSLGELLIFLFLSDSYLWDLGGSFFALLILFALAVTSFDFVIKKMTFSRWKLLHRLVYLAALLILIHMVFMGTHFRHISELIPQILFLAVSFLLLLEAPRFDKYVFRFLPKQRFSISFVLTAVLLVLFYLTTML